MNVALKSEFTTTQEIAATFGSTFQLDGDTEVAVKSEFELMNEVLASKNSEFNLWTESTSAMFEGTGSTATLPGVPVSFTSIYSGGYMVPNVVPSLVCVVNGVETDFSNYIKSCSATKTLGGKTYAEFVLVETPQDLNSYDYHVVADKLDVLNFKSSYCSNKFKYHGYDPSRYFRFSITVWFPGKAPQTYTYPYFLITKTETDGTELKIRMEDFTTLMEFQHLEQNPETTSPQFPDINQEAKKPGNAYQVIKQSASYAKISNVVIGFDDFPIKLLRRTQGRPLDWVAKVAAIHQAKMNFVGNTLYLTPTPYADAATASWDLAADMFEEGSFSVEQDLSNYKNSFRIIRTSSNGGEIGSQECIGNHCPGRTGRIEFSEAVNSCYGQAEVTNGTLVEFVYKDEFGNPVFDGYTVGPGAISLPYSPKPAKSVEFTYIAQIGNTPLAVSSTGDGSFGSAGSSSYGGTTPSATVVYTPRYKVTYFGKPLPTGFDDDFRLIKRDSAGIGCLGLHEDGADYDDSIIPNQAIASIYGDALLREATRQVIHFRGRTPLVIPQIEVGECATVSNYETDHDKVKFIISEHRIEIEGTEATMSLKGERERYADV